MDNIKKLQNIAKGISILYVEDNDSLREKAGKLLKKFFRKIDLAENGQVGLELFKKNKYPIVITDIKMPIMDGMTLIEHIKRINPDTKSIIMSAFDDKEYFLKGIELSIFRFLNKPVNATELVDVLYKAIVELKHEHSSRIFNAHLKNIFNYQSSMVLMFNNDKPTIANQIFLDYFGVESIDDFKNQITNFSSRFMPHDGFLYNDEEVDSLEVLKLNDNKLFHVKMKNLQGKIRHFILKYQIVSEQTNYGILSFDDVTELNLLKLFDSKETQQDTNNQNSQAMFDLLEVVQRNSAKISIHNYYKGLSITNDAIISDISDDLVIIKTPFLQQKAIQFEKKTILVSEAFPQDILCEEIFGVDFEKQTATLKSLKFIKTSPVRRKTIRVTTGKKQTVSLFMGEIKFHGDIEIEDISLDAVKIKLNALPAGLQKESVVVLDMVLELNKKPLIIHTTATVFRKVELKHSYSVVFLFKDFKQNDLVKYITSRQMELIREIKGL